MKRLSLIALLAFSLPAMSQKIEGKNMAKVNVSSFFLKGFGLQYERQVGKRVTVGLGYNLMPKSSIPFKSFFEDQIDDDDVNVEDFKLGTSIFTPEVRYYLGKKGAYHGFYIAPYARIGSYKIAGPVSYTSSTDTKRTAIFDGKLSTITGGVMLGSSWQLSDKFYLDWWIIGASYGGASGDLVAATQLSPSEQASLKRELDEIEIVGTQIESRVDGNGATVTTNGSMAGLRGLGINFGIRF